MKILISILCMGLSMLSKGLYGKNGVSGDLRWVGTRPPTDCPVSLGIPFLKGELEADGRVVLNDRDGADIGRVSQVARSGCGGARRGGGHPFRDRQKKA